MLQQANVDCYDASLDKAMCILDGCYVYYYDFEQFSGNDDLSDIKEPIPPVIESDIF
jgi:hypothetical protein